MPEYVWIYNKRKGSEYVSVLNVPHTIYSPRSLSSELKNPFKDQKISTLKKNYAE